MPDWTQLSVLNIQRVMDEIQDIRGLPQPLLFAGDRIPLVPAMDEEIMAYYTGRVVAADIIADDQKAVVRAANPIRLTQTKIPNLKHGELITQKMLSILDRIERGQASVREQNIFGDYLGRRVLEMRTGVYQRMEALCVAMLTDSFSYNRLGIIIEDGTWGMPSDLKPTTSTPWSSSTAIPVTQILTLKRIAAQKYGVTLDRVTMSTQALLYFVQTTEFKNVAQLKNAYALPATGYPAQDVDWMKNLVGMVTGMQVEIYDALTWTEDEDGSQSSAPYLPADSVVLTSQAGDGNTGYWDFANGEVTETLPGIVPSMIGSFPAPTEGPVAYTTAADPQGNPPGYVLWGVGRGFPRRHMTACSAVLNDVY